MEQKRSNKKLFALIAVVIVAAALVAVYLIARPHTNTGAKEIEIIVTDDQGSSTSYEVSTDAEYLRDTFDDAEGLSVEGEEGEYGFTILTVNDLTADFNTSNAYWAIYVNGEYGSLGADSQPVTDGDVFTLAYETY